MEEYNDISLRLSRLATISYSTSFSMGVRLLAKPYRRAIYAIYGFVRFADEIVDTFHGHDQRKMLERFREETFEAIETQVSTNPILQSFQWAVNTYRIDYNLIQAFLHSMEMDLTVKNHTEESFKIYVYGSAEVVGLMCLKVFYKDDEQAFESLIYPARKLGEAFQKINFLRDIHADYNERGRFYFPGSDLDQLNETTKKEIEKDIQSDFDEAYEGIRRLNRASRLGVLVSYTYYLKLFRKIRRTPASKVFTRRYRISNLRKIVLLAGLWIRFKLGWA